jgi:Domain of Unknown Function (DUF1080)
MKQLCLTLILATLVLIPAQSQNRKNPFAGRWDMTVTTSSDKFPGWMELEEKDGNPEARVQPRTGNVHPAPVKMDGARLIVTVSPANANGPQVIWELTAKSGKLSGVQKRGDAVEGQVAGAPAPAMKRAAPKAWTDPEPLFNGKDLTGWEPVNNTPATLAPQPAASHWTVKDGELTNEAKGSNLRTTRKFEDFKLHVEFNCPPEENSGVYLRGRYEVQVGPGGRGGRGAAGAGAGAPAGGGRGRGNAGLTGLGSIYGYLAPERELTVNPPGEWQVYDVTLVGRMVTIVFNGVTSVDNKEIPGNTGGALDSNEGEPGPFYLQGDHHGGIRYRKISVSVPKR